MSENEVREDFAGKLIRRFDGMKLLTSSRVVKLMLEDVNEPEEPVQEGNEEDEN